MSRRPSDHPHEAATLEASAAPARVTDRIASHALFTPLDERYRPSGSPVRITGRTRVSMRAILDTEDLQRIALTIVTVEDTEHTVPLISAPARWRLETWRHLPSSSMTPSYWERSVLHVVCVDSARMNFGWAELRAWAQPINTGYGTSRAVDSPPDWGAEPEIPPVPPPVPPPIPPVPPASPAG